MIKNNMINLTKNLELIIEDFWQVDCLIRVMKEVLTNQNWETQEEDIETICKILVKNSDLLKFLNSVFNNFCNFFSTF